MSTQAALGLIEALVASGDRVGALQFGGVHAALVRQHLDTEPDPAVEQWIGRLRSGDVPVAAPASAPPRSRSTATSSADDARAVAAHELQEIRRALADRYQVADKTGESTMLLTFSARDRHDTPCFAR